MTLRIAAIVAVLAAAIDLTDSAEGATRKLAFEDLEVAVLAAAIDLTDSAEGATRKLAFEDLEASSSPR
jgi:hypothetical protein